MTIPQQIVETIRSVAGDQRLILHEPIFQGNESKYVLDCIDSGWVSSVGSYVDKLELMLQEITGAKKAIAVSNGTSALQIALRLCGAQHNTEVLIPALTFVATANAVVHCGAIPHLVESEEQTFGIDPSKLDDYLAEITVRNGNETINKSTGRKIVSMVPMHCLGHPSKMEELLEVAEKYSLKLVEDSAESLGSCYQGRHTGTLGEMGILSFNGNKIVTTGGGGAILTDNEKLGDLAKHITTTAKVPHKWDFFHDQVGFNFRMPNLNAALGCAQLERLDQFVASKRKLASRYAAAFRDSESVDFVEEPEKCKSNFWLNGLLLKPEFRQEQEAILESTNSQGVMTRPLWKLMHHLPMYQDCPRMLLDVAESVQSRLINIPSGVGIANTLDAGQ